MLIVLIVLGILYQLVRGREEGFTVLPPRAYLDGARLANEDY